MALADVLATWEKALDDTLDSNPPAPSQDTAEWVPPAGYTAADEPTPNYAPQIPPWGLSGGDEPTVRPSAPGPFTSYLGNSEMLPWERPENIAAAEAYAAARESQAAWAPSIESVQPEISTPEIDRSLQFESPPPFRWELPAPEPYAGRTEPWQPETEGVTPPSPAQQFMTDLQRLYTDDTGAFRWERLAEPGTTPWAPYSVLQSLATAMVPDLAESLRLVTQPDYVPEWVRQEGYSEQWQELPQWEKINTQALQNVYRQTGLDILQKLTAEYERVARGEAPLYTDEQRREMRQQMGLAAGMFAAGMVEPVRPTTPAIRAMPRLEINEPRPIGELPLAVTPQIASPDIASLQADLDAGIRQVQELRARKPASVAEQTARVTQERALVRRNAEIRRQIATAQAAPVAAPPEVPAQVEVSESAGLAPVSDVNAPVPAVPLSDLEQRVADAQKTYTDVLNKKPSGRGEKWERDAAIAQYEKDTGEALDRVKAAQQELAQAVVADTSPTTLADDFAAVADLNAPSKVESADAASTPTAAAAPSTAAANTMTDVREAFGELGAGMGQLIREADLRAAEKRMDEARALNPHVTDEQAAASPLGQQIARYRAELAALSSPTSATSPATTPETAAAKSEVIPEAVPSSSTVPVQATTDVEPAAVVTPELPTDLASVFGDLSPTEIGEFINLQNQKKLTKAEQTRLTDLAARVPENTPGGAMKPRPEAAVVSNAPPASGTTTPSPEALAGPSSVGAPLPPGASQAAGPIPGTSIAEPSPIGALPGPRPRPTPGPTAPPTSPGPPPGAPPNTPPPNLEGDRVRARAGLMANEVVLPMSFGDWWHKVISTIGHFWNDQHAVEEWDTLAASKLGRPLTTTERAAAMRYMQAGAFSAAKEVMESEYRPILQWVGVDLLPDLNVYLIARDQVEKLAAIERMQNAAQAAAIAAGQPAPTFPPRKFPWGMDPSRVHETLREILSGVDPAVWTRQMAEMRTRLGPEVFDRLNPKQLNGLLKGVGAADFAKIERAADDIVAYNRRLLERRLKAEVISPDEFNVLTTAFPHYVPIRVLKYMDETPGKQTPGRRSISSPENLLHRLTQEGTESAQQAPLEALIELTNRTYGTSIKNEATLTIVKMAESDPTLNKIIRRAKEGEDLKDGEADFEVRRNGEVLRYIGTADVANMITREDFNLGPFWSHVSHWSRAPLKMGATQRNPVFLLFNIAGDLFNSIMMGEGPQWYVQGVWDVLRHGPATQAYLRTGGGMGKQSMYGNQVIEASRKAVAEMAGKPWYVIDSPKQLTRVLNDIARLRPIEGLGNKVELFSRVGAMLDDMTPAERAAIWAGAKTAPVTTVAWGRRVAMDFDVASSFSRGVGAFTPYFNPAFQSPAQIVRLLSDPKRRNGALFRLSAFVAAVVGLEVYNQRFPEYEDVRDYEKDRGLIVMLPWSGQARDAQGKPIPAYIIIGPTREWSAFAIMTRELIRAVQQKPGRGWERTALAVQQAMSPISGGLGGEAITGLLPPFPASMIEVGFNRDIFRERPIVAPELEAKPLAEQFNATTPQVFRHLGRIMNVSPAVVEYVVRSNFAGIADLATGVADLGLRVISEMPPPTVKPGEQLWGRYVPPKGDVLTVPAGELDRLRAEAQAGNGTLYVVAAKSEREVDNKLFAGEILESAGVEPEFANAPFVGKYLVQLYGSGRLPASWAQSPIVGRFVRRFYNTGGGQIKDEERWAADMAMGKGTAEQTAQAWRGLMPAFDAVREQQLVLDTRAGNGELSDADWAEERKKLQQYKQGMLIGAQIALPKSALEGERSREYKRIVDNVKARYGNTPERTEVLAQTYLAMEPPPGPDGQPDVRALMADRANFLSKLDANEQAAVLAVVHKNATPKEKEYYQAQAEMNAYMSVARYVGMDTARADKVHAAKERLANIEKVLPGTGATRREVALAELRRQDAITADLAGETIVYNEARNQFWQTHPLLERYYGGTKNISGKAGAVATGATPPVSVTTSITPPAPVSSVSAALGGITIATQFFQIKRELEPLIDDYYKANDPRTQEIVDAYGDMGTEARAAFRREHPADYQLQQQHYRDRDAMLAKPENALLANYISFLNAFGGADQRRLIEKVTGKNTVDMFVGGLLSGDIKLETARPIQVQAARPTSVSTTTSSRTTGTSSNAPATTSRTVSASVPRTTSTAPRTAASTRQAPTARSSSTARSTTSRAPVRQQPAKQYATMWDRLVAEGRMKDTGRQPRPRTVRDTTAQGLELNRQALEPLAINNGQRYATMWDRLVAEGRMKDTGRQRRQRRH